MSSPRPISDRRANADYFTPKTSENLDLDWILQAKKGKRFATLFFVLYDEFEILNGTTLCIELPQWLVVDRFTDAPTQAPAHEVNDTDPKSEATPQDESGEKHHWESLHAEHHGVAPHETAEPKAPAKPAIQIDTPSESTESPAPVAQAVSQPAPPSSQQDSLPKPQRPSLSSRSGSTEESRKGTIGSFKKDSGRRASWMSSLSSKFSSSSSKNANTDSNPVTKNAAPQPSPKLEFNNPFHKYEPGKPPETKDIRKTSTSEQPPVLTPTRRPSVLVAAGKETKLEHQGFFSSALRRLSSSNNASMGKEASKGAIVSRKVMNVDHNRERIKISDFDQNKLKRVAFCVDVEIAGYAAQADEEGDGLLGVPSNLPQSNASEKLAVGKKETKDAKYKDKGEGAALKNPVAASAEKEQLGSTAVDAKAKAQEEKAVAKREEEKDEKLAEKPEDKPAEPTTTRKKEKKKRSEEERKARKERKRKHAVNNGLVPLELKRDDEDSDSSGASGSPPGTSTPRKGDRPTTDPLRIYKRCCQLRETTILSRVKEQISKPAAIVAEAPGTVAIVDLSNLQMSIKDITTLGDWLAVVPVRKLVLDNCGLTDEAVRIVLSGLAGCKSAEQIKLNRKLPKWTSGKTGEEQMGVIEKLSLKHNPGITRLGWKYIALFLHMSKSLKGVDLSGIPFPANTEDLSRVTSATSTEPFPPIQNGMPKTNDVGQLFSRAVSERLGDKLEELILGNCGLGTREVSQIVDCAIKCGIRRLGFADNNLTQEALTHVARYIESGICDGLDLGGNNLHGMGDMITAPLDEKNPLFAISFANCGLTPEDITTILTPCTRLTNLKFIDLSRNPALFTGQRNAISAFRRLLPKLQTLKRIHLADINMAADHVIALAEILPDCPVLAHVSILENTPLIQAMNSKEGNAQEEACAFLASLMTAVRVSQTIIAIELEVPSVNS